MIADSDLIDAFLCAARLARIERPAIGLTNAHEWATAGRVAVHMTRQPKICALEASGIYVDIEYGQMSAAEAKKVGDGDVRIDIVLHRRGTWVGSCRTAIQIIVSSYWSN